MFSNKTEVSKFALLKFIQKNQPETATASPPSTRTITNGTSEFGDNRNQQLQAIGIEWNRNFKTQQQEENKKAITIELEQQYEHGSSKE
ncbi:hypothetical protein MTR_7g034100 [Medicago truncatula]|uniref:Uncharacterized protein n=1 Tax=Medicago truncatula TaxID=3880 RepID=A0A072TYB7_MEDTR|nr:hypothetical protein MTR_7g034100 [Medicago truncatula]